MTVAALYQVPQFYPPYWLYALCVLLALALAICLYRLRSLRSGTREQELERLVDEKTKALEEQRAFLRQVLDINPSFIFAKDREGRFTLVNQAIADSFRIPIRNLVGKTDEEIFPHFQEWQGFRRDDLEVMETLKEKFVPEEKNTDALGRVRYMQVVKRPIVGPDGIARQILGVATDITERKRAEEALAEERHLLRTLIDALPDCVYAKDAKSRFILGNIAVSHLMGAKQPDDIVGKSDFDFFLPALAKQYYADEQAVVESGHALIDREEPTIDPEGNRKWLSTTKVPLRDSQGKIVGIVGLGRDITERKTAEEELRKYKDRLEEQVAERTAELMRSEQRLRQAQKMEAIGTFSGGVAHDFNNLLTVIRGYASILLGSGLDPRLQNYAEQIDGAAERAAALTRQLLAFSRRQVMQPRVLDFNALLLNLDKMLQRLIGEDIEIETLAAPNLGAIKADPSQIEQVIMNLVVNARDAMPSGGKLTLESANVEVGDSYVGEHAEVPAGRYVMLAISDTGAGMDAETVGRVFEPFFTTKEMGRGTGLGLSMVYGIVKQSGGFISVYSEVGLGTTFKVYLPRVEQTPEAWLGSPQATANSRGTETIVLVEDDPQVRELARTVLVACGYSVLVAEKPEEATSICERHSGRIHLLLTDVVMPGINGRELAKRVVARRPEIKVLYMSGYTNNAIVHRGVLDSDTDFLPKPFTPNSLAEKVRSVLDQSASAA